jgi:hypothetical protein
MRGTFWPAPLFRDAAMGLSRGWFVRMSCFHGMLLALASALAASGRSAAGAGLDEGSRGVRSQAGRDALRAICDLKKPIRVLSTRPWVSKAPGGGAELGIGAFCFGLDGASPIPLPGPDFPLPATQTSIKPQKSVAWDLRRAHGQSARAHSHKYVWHFWMSRVLSVLQREAPTAPWPYNASAVEAVERPISPELDGFVAQRLGQVRFAGSGRADQ